VKSLRNAADKEEILRRLESIQTTSQRCWGRMSAHQMICHLNDGFRLYMGERPAAPVPMRLPRVLLKWTALWAPIPWPRGFKTMPEIDQQASGTPPVEFSSDIAELRNLISRFTEPPGRFSTQPHPHFGPLSKSEWLRLGYLHADHHLRQFGA
jgi:hypothetical protein